MILETSQAKVGVRMRPAEEKVKDADVRSAGFLKKETSARASHAREFVEGGAPIGDVMQHAEDHHVVEGCGGERGKIRGVEQAKVELRICLACDGDLLFHHVEAEITFGTELIEQVRTIARAAAHFEQVPPA